MLTAAWWIAQTLWLRSASAITAGVRQALPLLIAAVVLIGAIGFARHHWIGMGEARVLAEDAAALADGRARAGVDRAAIEAAMAEQRRIDSAELEQLQRKLGETRDAANSASGTACNSVVFDDGDGWLRAKRTASSRR
jgi:hypothetical protein